MGIARPVLLRRLRNDLEELGGIAKVDCPDIEGDFSFPLEISVVINSPGYSSPGVEADEHRFILIIGEDYPYERPRVRWMSPIFHPNIMPADEGGTVCVMALDHWDFDSSLGSFVQALTDLVNNPNPDNPLRSRTCEAAAEWFSDRL